VPWEIVEKREIKDSVVLRVKRATSDTKEILAKTLTLLLFKKM